MKSRQVYFLFPYVECKLIVSERFVECGRYSVTKSCFYFSNIFFPFSSLRYHLVIQQYEVVCTLQVFIIYACITLPYFSTTEKELPLIKLVYFVTVVCVCVFIFFHREGFFRLQNAQDILEGRDQRSCVVNNSWVLSAKFHHLHIWKFHISPSKTKTPAYSLLERKWYDIMCSTKRWYILI